MINQDNLESIVKRACKDHPHQNVMGVCLKVDCKGLDRLVCFECLIGDNKHVGHSKSVVALNSIYINGKCDGNWPQDNEGNRTKQFLQSLQQVKKSEEIDKSFDQFDQRVTEELNNVKIQVKQFYQEQNNQTQKYSSDLQEKFDKVYSLEKIVELIRAFHKGTINEQTLQQNITSFLKSDENKQSFEDLRKHLNDQEGLNLFTFDSQVFEACEKKTIGIIQRFSNSFSSSFCSIEFEVAPVKNPSSVQFTQQGSNYQWKHSSHSVVYTKIPLKEGRIKIRAKVDSYTSGCYVVGIERESQKASSNYWGSSTPACCIICKAQDSVSMVSNKPSEFIGNHFEIGKVLEIELCPLENIFNVGIEGTDVMFKLNQFQLNEWEPCRLFFNNYSGAPSGITILSSSLTN